MHYWADFEKAMMSAEEINEFGERESGIYEQATGNEVPERSSIPALLAGGGRSDLCFTGGDTEREQEEAGHEAPGSPPRS